MLKCSLERVYRIWDDKAGDFTQISDDDDGLGLMKISTVFPDGEDEEEIAHIHIHPDAFELFLKAVTEYIEKRGAE